MQMAVHGFRSHSKRLWIDLNETNTFCIYKFCYLTISPLLFRHIQTGNCLEQESISRIKVQRTASSGLSDMQLLQGVWGGWTLANSWAHDTGPAPSMLMFHQRIPGRSVDNIRSEKVLGFLPDVAHGRHMLNFLNDKTASRQAARWNLSRSAPLTITQLQSLYN